MQVGITLLSFHQSVIALALLNAHVSWQAKCVTGLNGPHVAAA